MRVCVCVCVCVRVCVCVCVSFTTGKAEEMEVRIIKKNLKKSAIYSFDMVNPVSKGLLKILKNLSRQSVYIVKIQEEEILQKSAP